MTTPNDPHRPDDESQEPGARDADVEDRAAILRRRAMFIASAVAGLQIAACGDTKPQPCLDYASPQDAGVDADPQPCLDVAPPEDAGMDADPQPCLGMRATGGEGGGGAGGGGGAAGAGGGGGGGGQ